MQLSHIAHMITKNAFVHHQATPRITNRIFHITLKIAITLIFKFNLCFDPFIYKSNLSRKPNIIL